MANQRHLGNAPIIEAIIDFRVKLPPEFNPGGFSTLSKTISSRYPKSEPRKLITGTFGMKENKPFINLPEMKGIQGYIYKTEDEKNVAQFRIDGFTFSRLKPYTEWENIISEARSLWGKYYDQSSPELISRIAVRYINKLDLPIAMKKFEEYLTAPPQIPESLPQEVSQFLTRVVIHKADITANIIQTLDRSQKPKHLGVILDIDVYKTSQKGIDESSLWTEFERLRNMKNLVFFESITEKTARLYE